MRQSQHEMYRRYLDAINIINERFWLRIPLALFGKRYLLYLARLRPTYAVALLDPHFDDIEAELTYLLIRESKPNTIVEIGALGGWSTSWILSGLRDNRHGKLYSFDKADDSTKTLPPGLTENRWVFVLGDILKDEDSIPRNIDYLLVDANHTADFARWYLEKIFPKVSHDSFISVHDMFHASEPKAPFGEGVVISAYLSLNNIPYLTSAPAKNKWVYDQIMKIKKELDIQENITESRINPAVFFNNEQTGRGSSNI